MVTPANGSKKPGADFNTPTMEWLGWSYITYYATAARLARKILSR
jgi:hypothetical protein